MMFFQVRRAVERYKLGVAWRQLWSTPPVAATRSGVTVVSMVSTHDTMMYILAAKAFLSRLGRGRPVALNDGSLTSNDIRLLQRHLPGIVCVDIADVPTGPCPRGGCWERLLYVLSLGRQEYVIQLDSDTLTYGPIEEICECVDNNRGFILGESATACLMSMDMTRTRALSIPGDHVQIAAEQVMYRLPDAERRLYVRGSAGFAGFPAKAVSRRDAEQFSTSMEELLGRQWHNWGSEQVTSNYLIANTAGAIVLPYPRYAPYEPIVQESRSVFLHFYGAYRFRGGVYVDLGRRVIHELTGAHGTTGAAPTLPPYRDALRINGK